MPTRITRVLSTRKPDRKGTQTVPWRVHRSTKWLVIVIPKPHDRFRPGGWVIRITTGISPENCTTFIRQVAGERFIQADKPLLDELLNLMLFNEFISKIPLTKGGKKAK